MSSKKRTGKSGKHKRGKNKKPIRIGFGVIACILSLLALFIALPHIKDKSPRDKGAEVPQGEYSYGIDISHYQDNIQWDSLMVMTDGAGRTIRSKIQARSLKPVSFVFIKATEGSNMKDRNFRKHWEAAGKEDIRRGAYHFFRSSKSGRIQADHFIRTVGSLRYKDLPPVLDIETIHPGCTNEILNKRALEWLHEVESHYGRKPIVYSSASFINEHLSEEIRRNYPIWVAHYDVDSPAYDLWRFWQFTDKAIVYGINGHIDLNVCRSADLKIQD